MPYSIDEIFEVVNEVERYKEFLPGCERSTVLKVSQHSYEAQLDIAVFGLTQHMVTRNTPTCNRAIKMELVDGPFERLDGMWTFKDLGEGCRVTLSLECEFDAKLLRLFSTTLAKKGIAKTVEAFVGEVRRRHDSC